MRLIRGLLVPAPERSLVSFPSLPQFSLLAWSPERVEHAHLGEDVAHDPALVVLSDERELRPGESVVEVWTEDARESAPAL